MAIVKEDDVYSNSESVVNGSLPSTKRRYVLASLGGKKSSSVKDWELLSDVFNYLLETIIVDVASESHRIIKLGLDRNLDKQEEELRLSAEARARVSDPSHNGEVNGKYVVDIFGQTHPAIASEIFDCMNCGRSIMAGRFAPHLEKCMGKGRKARVKATRSSTAGQNRYSRGSPYSNSTNMNRSSNGNSCVAGDDYSNGNMEEL